MLQLLSEVLSIGQQGIFDAASALSDRSQLMEAWEHGGGRAVQWFPRLHRQAPSKFGALGSYGTEGLSFDELPGHVRRSDGVVRGYLRLLSQLFRGTRRVDAAG